MPKNLNFARAIILVFLASACSMVLELIASRILAPYIGVSLYTWTSIIGIVLAGISLGNYLGGKIGDKYTSPVVLSAIFFTDSMLCLVILPLTVWLNRGPLPVTYHIMSRATIYTLILFFLPTMILGMVTPIVIKLTLKDLAKTARIVGSVYAISCVGSILGTFLTGFLLISWFGTRTIIWGLSAVLFLMAILSNAVWLHRVKLLMFGGNLLVFAFVFLFMNSQPAFFLKESNYYTINVFDTTIEGRTVKALALDHLIHSYVDLQDPKFQAYEYERVFACFARSISATHINMNVMFIGGGGYSFPRYLELAYPQSNIDVVEIDPAVTQTAYQYLGLPETSRINTYNVDARIFVLNDDMKNKYDMVIGDAFNDVSVPYHLTTYEFNEKVKNVLKPDGIYAINVIDNIKDGTFARSFMKTLEKSFNYVGIFQRSGSSFGSYGMTYIVVATNREPFSPASLIPADTAGYPEYVTGNLITLQELEKQLVKDGSIIPSAIVLSDNYVPVDNMLAPLFVHR